MFTGVLVDFWMAGKIYEYLILHLTHVVVARKGVRSVETRSNTLNE